MTQQQREPTQELPILQGLTNPSIFDIDDGHEFSFIEERHCPSIQLRDLHRDRSGNLMAELSAYCLDDPNIMIPVNGIRFNLSSLSQRKSIAKGLKDNYQEIEATWIDWERILAKVCNRAILLYRDGLNPEVLWPGEDLDVREPYLIEPILPKNDQVIIFGDGGVGKGYLALILAITAQLPFTTNHWGLKALDEPTNCLYLDYEDNTEKFQRRLTRLCRGLDINVGINRIPMSKPLAECVDSLKTQIFTHKAQFLIVDSLGPAAGGNINDAEPAIKYHNALRQLSPITVLSIAHNAKETLTNKRSPFGSVFFTVLARSIWEVVRHQDEGSPEMLVALKHYKSNEKKHLPLGFKFTFADHQVDVTKASPDDLLNSSIRGAMPIKDRIRDLLSEQTLTAKEIAEELVEKEGSVRVILNRESRTFAKVGAKWGLLP